MKKKNRTVISEFIRNLPIQKKLLFSFVVLIVFPAVLIGILHSTAQANYLSIKTRTVHEGYSS